MYKSFLYEQVKNSLLRFLRLSIVLTISLPLVLTNCNSESTSPDEGQIFESNRIAADEMYTQTLEMTRTIQYHCTIHEPDMKGTINIEQGAESTVTVTVTMENEEFQPQEITIAPNTTVLWVNRDNFAHTVVSGQPHENGNSGGGYYYPTK